MDFGGLDLNLLVVLDALFAERSVSRAGERVHLSQSATSGALARLRDAFHDPLMVQVGRKMTLTALAEELVEPVRQFLLKADAILNSNPAFDPAVSTRRFRMMMSDYVETVLMTEVLPRMQQQAPGVTVELVSNVDASHEVLDRGEIDLSVVPKGYESSVHPSERLFEDQFICLVWSGNPQVGRELPLETYLNLGHVVVRFGKHQQLPMYDELFIGDFRSKRKIEVVTTAFNLVPQLLIGTSRVATVQRRLAVFYQRYLPLKLVDPPIEIPPLEERLQWHKSRDSDPGTVWLRSLLKKALEDSATNSATTTARASVARKARKPPVRKTAKTNR
jgi:DNA-binding transcriptional LysR family regulator